MSLAAETRDAVRARPFLHDALRAGVLNYAAAARALDVDGDPEAIAAALRRFEDELDESTRDDPGARPVVRMERGLQAVAGEGLLGVDGSGYAPGDGAFTGVLATGDVDARSLETALGVLRVRDVPVEAAGVAGDALVVVVERGDGPDALRAIENGL
ncbi:MAG: hypothetical protein ABEH66_01725 [Halobacteriales archaeon]